MTVSLTVVSDCVKSVDERETKDSGDKRLIYIETYLVDGIVLLRWMQSESITIRSKELSTWWILPTIRIQNILYIGDRVR